MQDPKYNVNEEMNSVRPAVIDGTRMGEGPAIPAAATVTTTPKVAVARETNISNTWTNTFNSLAINALRVGAATYLAANILTLPFISSATAYIIPSFALNASLLIAFLASMTTCIMATLASITLTTISFASTVAYSAIAHANSIPAVATTVANKVREGMNSVITAVIDSARMEREPAPAATVTTNTPEVAEARDTAISNTWTNTFNSLAINALKVGAATYLAGSIVYLPFISNATEYIIPSLALKAPIFITFLASVATCFMATLASITLTTISFASTVASSIIAPANFIPATTRITADPAMAVATSPDSRSFPEGRER